jgi:hypothetical protein
VSQRSDEARHAPGTEQLWNESWYVDFHDGGDVGGYLRLGLYPNLGVAWWWAYLVRGDQLIVVRDHEVPLPKGDALEIRADALWGEMICETPMEHWTLRMEAFGVLLDSPRDSYHGERGERLAAGLDLEWEALGPWFDYPHGGGHAYTGHYQHAGAVHGEILLGRERIPFEGTGERDHSWGPRDWWAVGWHWSSFQIGDSIAVNLAKPDLPGIPYATGYIARDGRDPRPVTRADLDTVLGEDGIPTSARYTLDAGEEQLAVELEVLAAAPVPLVSPVDGRTARFPRALCRFTTADGEGTGWAEWLQVPSPTA